MYINVDNLLEVIERHPELEIVRNITANHGFESEISQLCELIAKLYVKVDGLMNPSANASVSSESAKPARVR